ncbi:MAG: heavy-metal-associated domain-containing protein [Ignavibacteria bacterium]
MKVIQIFFILLIISLVFQACGKKQTQQTTTTEEKQVATVEFKCPGMHCSGCEQTITAEVKKLEGIKEIQADAKAKLVKVVYLTNKVSPKDIEKSINAAGYDTESSKSDTKHNCDEEMNN